jgi:hypothetical protein
MPTRKRQRREPTHEWQQIEQLVLWPEQEHQEVELTDFDGGHKAGNPAQTCAFLPHHGVGFPGGEQCRHLAQFVRSVGLPFVASEKLRQAQFKPSRVKHRTQTKMVTDQD